MKWLAKVQYQAVINIDRILVQWKLKMRTPLGPVKSVLIREVSLFQGYTLVLHWDTEKCPDYRGVPISGSPHFEVPLYMHIDSQ